MITKEQLAFIRKEGLIPTPINPNTKRPVAVKGHWFYDWKDEEILAAADVGIYHRDKNKNQICAAVDPDDKDYVTHGYMSMLPASMQVSKKVNGSVVNTQKIYKVNGQGFPKFDYGGSSKDEGKLVETLQSGISVIHSPEKNFSITPLREVDPDELQKKLKLISFFTEVEKNFPSSTSKKRDTTHLALQGALARLDENLYSTSLLEGFIEQLCINTGDDEITNRVNKLGYQREQLKKGVEEVKGVPALCAALNVKQLPAYDLLKSETEETTKPYPVMNFTEMLEKKYIQPSFIADPLLREKTTTQISGDYGSGKTHLGLKLAIDISQGFSFLPEDTNKSIGGYEWYRHCGKKLPILYVEGELPAVDIRDRVNSLLAPFIENKQKSFPVDLTNMFFLTLDDLELAGFKFGFEPIAISNDEGTARRNRKKIEQMIKTIKNKTGKNPVLFLDNITALTSIDENKATDWSGLMHWIMLLKTRGIMTIFFHHVGKSTGTASGSNLAQRLVDTHIILKRLPEKAKFEDHDGVQCSVHFDKFRNFGGRHAKPFMLLCDKEGNWTKYNMLMDKIDFKILEYLNEGKDVKTMCKIDPDLKESTCYRRIGKMKQEGIIKDGSDNIEEANY